MGKKLNHITTIKEFLKHKYEIKEENINLKDMIIKQNNRLISSLSSKTNHGKIHQAFKNNLIDKKRSTLWLKKRNIQPRTEALYVMLQDRNIFYNSMN